MTPRRFVPIAIFVALQSSVLQGIDQILRHAVPPADNLGFTWVAFLAWATYFLAGSTVRGGAKALIGVVIGILYSIGVLVLGDWLGAFGFLASPMAILLLIPLVMYLELGPDLVTLVPAVFVGRAPSSPACCMSQGPPSQPSPQPRSPTPCWASPSGG